MNSKPDVIRGDAATDCYLSSSLVRCSECRDSVLLEDAEPFDRGGRLVMVCRYCLDERHKHDDTAKVKQSHFCGVNYAPGDQRAHDRLERAEEHLREAVKRYFRNCPSAEMVRKIVDAELDT